MGGNGRNGERAWRTVSHKLPFCCPPSTHLELTCANRQEAQACFGLHCQGCWWVGAIEQARPIAHDRHHRLAGSFTGSFNTTARSFLGLDRADILGMVTRQSVKELLFVLLSPSVPCLKRLSFVRTVSMPLQATAQGSFFSRKRSEMLLIAYRNRGG